MYARPYKVLMFDWDGTLSDSAAVILAGLRGAGAELDLEPLEESRLRSIIGLSLEEAAFALHGVRGSQAQAFADAYRSHFFAASRPVSALFPGVRATLEMLREAGFVLTVATGKGRAGLDRELARCGLESLFDLTRCADETRSKPHPQMVLELLTDADCDASEALVIGDTDFDLMMATAAGVDCVAVTCGNHPPERLHACAPAAVLDDVAALPAWLGRRVSR